MSYQYKPPAVTRAIKVIEFISQSSDAPRLSRLAREFDLSKSTLHGILYSLVEGGWLQKTDNGGFSLTAHLRGLFRPQPATARIRETAKPFMDYLAEHTNESVFLGLRDADKVVIQECVQGPKEMRISARIGNGIPLLAGAIGKIFLSDMSPSDLKQFLEANRPPKFTDRSISDLDKYRAEVEKAKKQGYALDNEEYLPGVRAVAVPIKQKGRITAGLWIVGFSSQLNEKVLDRARDKLLDAGNIISRILERQVRSAEIEK
ncbi:MAG: IclR family transcriptional regulator [Desulfohalobiaceae bacterium]|nr:IclR family transcriptional regulator [Desulfohalobiaceae bacterium]